jgi:hypothetical protein
LGLNRSGDGKECGKKGCMRHPAEKRARAVGEQGDLFQ